MHEVRTQTPGEGERYQCELRMTKLSATRKGFPYSGLSFSEDGCTAWMDGISYRETVFPEKRENQFNKVIILVILLTFPGIPLMANMGLQRSLFVIVPLMLIPFLLFNRKIHRCPQCNTTTRQVSTPYMNAPVLFFCSKCRLFFEHGHIDGGIPSRSR